LVLKIKYSYDLHIHSILSPCADELMTPNNILNMAMLKKLDFLAITDHNTAKQLKVFDELAESYDFVLIPGVEVTVNENFDVLCLFKTFDDAYVFDIYLETHLNGEWGTFTKENQVITDIYDETVETFNTPLTSTNIPFSELLNETRKLDGAIILSHIDRGSHSALNVFSLDDLEFDAIEIQKHFKDEFLDKNPDLNKYKILFNSDSHTLMSISEEEFYLELEEKTVNAFFKFIKG